ncbi:MAG: DNA protecting protein DprA [Candidatus Levybacteria bacterium RIFCSPHIGHO2_01_FULL_37_17]|nr:MAG: DNA protecting protein DprA [Candidatus Levybacteria bacterium RIFCSPHIGHO2_01_FULL_37_17]OGH36611.1 MAG: DNA protecting protein DprA [Candidatus Levybacteria bacterium RIFCSPLOWO2_01_FULL_38_23]
MEERDYYLGFSLVSGIGPKTFAQLLKYFKTAETAWNASLKEFKNAGLGELTTQKFEKARGEFNFAEYKRKLKLQKIDYIAIVDKEYSPLLKQIPNPPILLFIKGNKSLLKSSQILAIVGTRKMTNYGQEVTEKFAFELASAGFTIVSGMALGVDGQAHSSTMFAKGKTIAVLGNGVDLPFPTSNQNLYHRILESGGAIISEFPPGEPPNKGTFPSRNRIIAGISQGILVTEGAEDSGSLITANYGLEFKRKVFAVPGPITSPLSAAPLRLIEKGARLVVSPDDILKEFDVRKVQKDKESRLKGLTKEELKIAQIIENEPLSFDEIVRKLNSESSKVATILSIMEIKGIIKNFGGNYSLN